MSFQIYITKTAERDLIGACDYIEFMLYNPTAADDLLDEAIREINALADFPECSSVVDDPVLKEWGIRFILIKNYMVFYKIDEAAGIVYIVRFLYQKRDWAAILRGCFSLE